MTLTLLIRGNTPSGISNDVTTDARLGLTVNGDTLSGDILVGCSNVSAAMCSQTVTDMQGINGTDGKYTAALNIRAAAAGESPSFELHGGGSHAKYNGWFSKKFRMFGRNYGREIHLFSGNAGYTSETTVHELGHFLGLAHQANSTNSFMSYSRTRNAVPVSSDFNRLVEGYR